MSHESICRGEYPAAWARCPCHGGVARASRPWVTHGTNGGECQQGLSLLEMMLVVAVILIVAAIAAPIYRSCEIRAREAVLRDHLDTMRRLIDEFTKDYGRAPMNLEEIVKKGYLGRLPTDPFTGSNQTWQEVKEAAPLSLHQTGLGIEDVHSGSNGTSLEGTPYSSW